MRDNPQVSSVLITGGDPMVMKTAVLRRYIEPLLRAKLTSLHSIRIGTKALAYWPNRFTEGENADDFLRLIGEVEGGRQTLRADGALEPLAGTGAGGGTAGGSSAC